MRIYVFDTQENVHERISFVPREHYSQATIGNLNSNVKNEIESVEHVKVWQFKAMSQRQKYD